MKTNRILLSLILIVALIGLWYLSYPTILAHRLIDAIDERDSETLDAMLGTDCEVRDELTEQARDRKVKLLPPTLIDVFRGLRMIECKLECSPNKTIGWNINWTVYITLSNTNKPTVLILH